MAFDPRQFHPMVVSDTCAVWHMLSARRLYHAAFSSKLFFCITPTVLYELVYKPRKAVTPEMKELLGRLDSARNNGKFPVQECDLDDLLSVTSIAPRLGSGELSCIAMAYGISTIAFMTDEKKARRFAEERLNLRVETTPRLYGWLHFQRCLCDADHQEVVTEHEKYEHRPLTKHFNEAYEVALQYRLAEQQR